MLLEKLGAVGFLSAIKASGLLAFAAPAMLLRTAGPDAAGGASCAIRPPVDPLEADLALAGESEAVRRIMGGTHDTAERIRAFHAGAGADLAAVEDAVAQLRKDLAAIAVTR